MEFKGDLTIELARSGGQVIVPHGERILNALRDVGVKLDFQCERGVCGKCEVRVVAGRPLHRDSRSGEDLAARPDVLRICCGWAATPALCLDI